MRAAGSGSCSIGSGGGSVGIRDGTGRLLDRRWFVRIGNHWRIAGGNRRIRQRVYVQKYYDRNGRTASCAVRLARSSKRLVDSKAWLIASR